MYSDHFKKHSNSNHEEIDVYWPNIFKMYILSFDVIKIAIDTCI